MDNFIRSQNIRRYEEMLSKENDPQKRGLLLKLLLEERERDRPSAVGMVRSAE